MSLSCEEYFHQIDSKCLTKLLSSQSW